jgi:ketosteroid isomerase-like protein
MRNIFQLHSVETHVLMKMWLSGTVCLLTTVMSLSGQTKDGSCSGFSGTWYGSFRIVAPNGKSMRDNAVLVLTGDCATMYGSAGSTIDQQAPISRVQLTADEIRFHMEPMDGLDFQLKREGNHLVGTATGKVRAAIDVQPAPGLLPHDQLVAEIADADRELFESFETCNIAAYANYLSPDLEFYHDQGGKTGYQEQLDSLRQRCGEGLILRRKLVKDSLIVNAAPGFGAIEAATHEFYAKRKDGTEHLDATAKFTEIWTKASGSWKLIRVISYDHK